MDVRELFDTNEDFHEYVMKYIRTKGKSIEQALREQTVKDVAEYYASNKTRKNPTLSE